MPALKKRPQSLSINSSEELFRNPTPFIKKTINRIYNQNKFEIGFPKNKNRIFENLSRKNTCAIVGAALGDEGKGRLIDNKISDLLKRKTVKKVAVIRFQGGNNAGHSIEKNGEKLDLHLLPSSVLYKEAIGIMDRGELMNAEDLATEVEYVEKIVGSLKDRIFLSEDAILNTDLDRAEETLNRIKTGKAKGGTGRGIGPSYAHHYDRLGLRVYDLLNPDFREILTKQYERCEKEFAAFNLKLKDIEVPDFRSSHEVKKAINRTLGSKKEFLERLETARKWIIKRNLPINTYPFHQKIYADKTFAILFEGAQAAGLDAWTGTLPDITASNTSVYGIREGTGFWRISDIEERIGIFKIPYTSSVGARKMPTHVELPKDLKDLKNPTPDQKWAAYVRETAHEYGTTTGRPRDITHLDLEFIRYNARMSGVETLAGTHLDTSEENHIIKVCTHYTDKKGTRIPYQPGLRYQENIIPQYIELPGWDGTACQKAKSIKDLPKYALKFLAMIQSLTGYPIVAVTTGFKRDHFLAFEGYSV